MANINEQIQAFRNQLAAEEISIEAIAAQTGWPIIDDCLVPEPDVWHADDGNAELVYDGVTNDQGRYFDDHEPKVASAEEAASAYVETGDWGEVTETAWIHIHTWREGIDSDGDIVMLDREEHVIDLDPAEPKCTDEYHDWQSPVEIVGGIKESPGVWGHGGGVVIHECCMHCGCGKIIDTWAQDPNGGEQGLRSVRYEPDKYQIDVEMAEKNAG